MSRQRRRVIFSGRVQGVGFRFTTQRLARSFPVTGFVQNLPDGDVELVAEGEPTAVSAFLMTVRETFDGKIHSTSVDDLPLSDPPYTDFSIRYWSAHSSTDPD